MIIITIAVDCHDPVLGVWVAEFSMSLKQRAPRFPRFHISYIIICLSFKFGGTFCWLYLSGVAATVVFKYIAYTYQQHWGHCLLSAEP